MFALPYNDGSTARRGRWAPLVMTQNGHRRAENMQPPHCRYLCNGNGAVNSHPRKMLAPYSGTPLKTPVTAWPSPPLVSVIVPLILSLCTTVLAHQYSRQNRSQTVLTPSPWGLYSASPLPFFSPQQSPHPHVTTFSKTIKKT